MQVHAQIDTDGLLTATGFGTVDPAVVQVPAQGRMLAKRAAQVDAQRQLTEMVKGVQIVSGTTVENYEVTSDVTATRIKNWLQGMFKIDETVTQEEGTWSAEVVLGVCLTSESEACKGKLSLQDITNELEN